MSDKNIIVIPSLNEEDEIQVESQIEGDIEIEEDDEEEATIQESWAGAFNKATKDRYGVVRIGKGIKVVDGVIMVDAYYQGTVTSVNEIEPDTTGNVDTLVLSEPSEPKNKQIFIEITGSEEPIQMTMMIEDNFGTQGEEELSTTVSGEDNFGTSGEFETFDTGISMNQNVFGY